MTLTATFDTIEIVIGDAAPMVDERGEPTLAPSYGPIFVEFDEPERLDPKRLGLIWELPPASVHPIRLRSPLVSLAMHLLPLLSIIAWPTTTDAVPAPIPIQVVFEEPPPAPAPQPPPPKFETGRLASVDMGDVKPLQLGPTVSQAPPAAGETQPNPSETQTATAATPLRPLPKPTPPKEHPSPFQLQKPAGAPVPQHAAVPQPSPQAARFAGPAATRDEYLAYLVSLTRQHIDLLPMSLVGNRRGETVISVVVYDNGTIGPLGIVHSSGYPDLDQRIQQMVAAVRKFPPLPQWYQGRTVQLELTLRFPEALQLQ